MASYRGWVRASAALATALAVVMGSVFADEIYGVITKVDPEARKITVFQKKADKETVLIVDEDAELITPKDESGSKVDLKKMEKMLSKSKERNPDAKGIRVRVTHEGDKASKIEVLAKKKAAAE
ncbi:hypothetical protein [Paludisphaera soli]|uniref:hypothetical protein n=1 Tax=Paludisphaera soli TaxID=2712865 RepID=UPI0013ED499B|nr:hypothetical protein [Paludisphaera soli]